MLTSGHSSSSLHSNILHVSSPSSPPQCPYPYPYPFVVVVVVVVPAAPAAVDVRAAPAAVTVLSTTNVNVSVSCTTVENFCVSTTAETSTVPVLVAVLVSTGNVIVSVSKLADEELSSSEGVK